MGASVSTTLSPAEVKRATSRCEASSRAYWACASAHAPSEAAGVASSFSSSRPSPSAPPSACAPLRDSLTHCLCEAAARAVAESYARCAISSAGRGDFTGGACVKERDLMLRALRAAGLVTRRRAGLWSYYSLARPTTTFHKKLLECLRHCFSEVPELQADDRRAAKLAKAGPCCPPAAPRHRSTAASRRR